MVLHATQTDNKLEVFRVSDASNKKKDNISNENILERRFSRDSLFIFSLSSSLSHSIAKNLIKSIRTQSRRRLEAWKAFMVQRATTTTDAPSGHMASLGGITGITGAFPNAGYNKLFTQVWRWRWMLLLLMFMVLFFWMKNSLNVFSRKIKEFYTEKKTIRRRECCGECLLPLS